MELKYSRASKLIVKAWPEHFSVSGYYKIHNDLHTISETSA